MGTRRAIVGILAFSTTSLIIAMASPVVGSSFTVTREVIDARDAGDCTVLADLDGSGIPALVNGGGLALGPVPLRRHPVSGGPAVTVAHPAEGRHFTGTCAAADIDGDGDADLVAVQVTTGAADGVGSPEVVWHETPGPGATPWAQHVIGTHPAGVPRDLVVTRLDGPGVTTVVTRSTAALRRWSRPAVGASTATAAWNDVDVAVPAGRGLTAADVDGDGDADLLAGGLLLETTGAGTWRSLDLAGTASGFAAVGDVTGDGRADVVLGPADGAGPITLHTGRPGERWPVTAIGTTARALGHLALADFDADGDLDVITAVPFGEVQVLLSVGGRWDRTVIDPDGMGRFAVADVDRDGDPDVAGSNPAGNPPLVLFRNNGPTVRAAQPGPPTDATGDPTTVPDATTDATPADDTGAPDRTPADAGGAPLVPDPAGAGAGAGTAGTPDGTADDGLPPGGDLPGPLDGGRTGPAVVTGPVTIAPVPPDEVVVLPDRLMRTRGLDVPRIVLAAAGLIAFLTAWTLFGTPLRILPTQRAGTGRPDGSAATTGAGDDAPPTP